MGIYKRVYIYIYIRVAMRSKVQFPEETGPGQQQQQRHVKCWASGLTEACGADEAKTVASKGFGC